MFGKRMKVRLSGQNLVFTVPRQVAKNFNIVKGTELDVTCDGPRIIVDLTTAERSKLFDPPVEAAEPSAA